MHLKAGVFLHVKACKHQTPIIMEAQSLQAKEMDGYLKWQVYVSVKDFVGCLAYSEVIII